MFSRTEAGVCSRAWAVRKSRTSSTALILVVDVRWLARLLSDTRLSATAAAISAPLISSIGSSMSASTDAIGETTGVIFWTGSATKGSAWPASASRTSSVAMEHVKLTGQANTARTAVMERLHPGGGDADRIRVVAVRLEEMGGEIDLCALDPARSRSEPDRVWGPAAGSFKTAGADAA